MVVVDWWSSGDDVKPVDWGRIPPIYVRMVCLSRERVKYGYSGYGVWSG